MPPWSIKFFNMKKYKLLKDQFIAPALLLLALIPVLLPLTKPGFFPTQDYIYVARIFQMNKSLLDGQFPVRWVSDFRYGEPLYNFYAPLAYYAGVLIKLVGFDYLTTTKILFGLGFLLAGLAMFFLGKRLFGIWGGLLSALLYSYAPYHSVDVYVRGALSESWALIFFPLIFLFSWDLSQKPTKRNFIFLVLSLAGLFFTHNIMTVLFSPFFAAWLIFLIWRERNLTLLKYFIPAALLGFGLAATFLLPAFFEKNYVQSQYLLNGYFNYRGHFVAWPQFFSTFWGYGASLWGPVDGMSFQIGLAHWGFLGLSLVLAIIFKKNKRLLCLNIFLTFMFLFSLFMQHNLSAFIWEKLSILSYTQFPWRFLGISIFLVSLIGGSVSSYLPQKLNLSVILFGLIIILVNIGYFHPESYYLDSVDAHYISDQVLSQDDKLPKDYLPIWVKEIQKEKITQPEIKQGEADVSNFTKRSDSASFNINVLERSILQIPITYFPGWTVYVDGIKTQQEKPSNLGLIIIGVNTGQHRVEVKFENTPIRNFANILSLISAGLLISLIRFNVFKLRWEK